MQLLAGGSESRPDDLEEGLAVVHLNSRRRSNIDPHDCGVDFWRWAKGVGAQTEQENRCRIELHRHRKQRQGAIRGNDRFRDFPLDRQNQAQWRQSCLEQAPENWRRYVIRDIGDDDVRGREASFGKQVARLVIEDVCIDDANRRIILKAASQPIAQSFIQFDGSDSSAGCHKRCRQLTGACANFNDSLLGFQLGRCRNPLERLRIDQEMLTELLTRSRCAGTLGCF